MLGKLKKNAWAIGLVLVAVSSFVGAYTTNQFIAQKLAPPEKVQGLPPPGAGSSRQPPPDQVARKDSPEPPASLPTVPEEAPPPPSEPAVPMTALLDYEGILIRNIFDSANSLRFPESTTGDEETPSGPSREPLSIRLLGTVAASPTQFSWASISRNDPNAAPEIFRIGDDLFGQGTLKDVRRNQIVVTRPDGSEETVDLYTGQETPATQVATSTASKDGAPPLGESIRKIGENKFEIDAREIQSAMDNMDKLATSARIVPSFENGNPAGFKVFRIKPDSFYNKLGIRNGDIISKINGFEINSTEKALQMYQMLRTEKNITLDVTRRGQKMTLEYYIR